MEIRDLIEGEYRLFRKKKLLFETIFPGTYEYLCAQGLLQPTEFEISVAKLFVNYYRMAYRQNNLLTLDDLKFENSELLTLEEKRTREEKFKKELVEKSLVYQYYEKQEFMSKLYIFPQLLPDESQEIS